MKCSNCQHEVDSSSSFCSQCGVKISKSPSITPPTDGDGNRYRIRQYNAFCGHCHQRVEVGSTFCSHCGVAMEWAQSVSQSAPVVNTTTPVDTTPATKTIDPPKFEAKDVQPSNTGRGTETVPSVSTQPQRSDSVYCTHCGSKIPEGKLFCDRCGAIRRITPTSEPTEPVQKASNHFTAHQQQNCSQCGHALRPGKNFCTFCGTRINEASQSSPVTISEHDAFGPWVYEVDDIHPLPPLFSAYQTQLGNALMVFKIPRNIDRRDAHRYTNLYDAVVGIFKTHVLIIQRRGNTVQDTNVRLSDVQAISNNCCLLRGTMTLYTNTMSFSVVYNTVSSEAIDKAIDLIHAIQQNRKYSLNLRSMDYNTVSVGHLLCHLINGLKKNDTDIKLVAYQSETFKIQQTMGFATNDRELILIDHETTKKMEKGKPKTYSYSTVYIPINQLAAVRISNHPDDSGTKRLSFSTRNHTFTCSYTASNTSVTNLYDCLRRRCTSI